MKIITNNIKFPFKLKMPTHNVAIQYIFANITYSFHPHNRFGEASYEGSVQLHLKTVGPSH